MTPGMPSAQVKPARVSKTSCCTNQCTERTTSEGFRAVRSIASAAADLGACGFPAVSLTVYDLVALPT